ncbi:MAG: hypothetical protein WBC91_01785 [Phototrophicaceae bacterium]
MLLAIKFVHSLIIIYMMLCLYSIWHYAITGIPHPFVPWAIASVIGEAIVFIIYGWECPLTRWAIQLGDDTGADFLSELLYLEQVEFTSNYAIFCILGIMLAGRRFIIQNTNQQKDNYRPYDNQNA